MLTLTDDTLVDATLWNEQVRDMGKASLRRPGAAVSVAAQFNATGSNINPTFDTVGYDTDGMVNLATLPNGLTIVTPGMYLVSANYDFKSAGTGAQRASVVAQNSTGPDCCRYQNYRDYSAAAQIGSITAVIFLDAGALVQYNFNSTSSDTWTFGNQVRIALSCLWLSS